MSIQQHDNAPAVPHRRAPSLTVPSQALREVNEQSLKLLVQVAQRPGSPCSDFVALLRKPLCALNRSAEELATRCMFLLVDMHFRSLEWWDTLAHHPTAPRPVESWLVVFPRQRGIMLARSVLTLAWHVARTDRESAVVFLGLSPPVSELISLFSLQQIDRIAGRHFSHLRPRWADSPAMWHEVFAAFQGDATSGDSVAQREWSTLAGEFRPRWHH